MAKRNVPSVDFTVATYNAAYHLDRNDGAPEDYDYLFTNADVVAFQEMGRDIDKKQLRAAAAIHGFDFFEAPNSKSTPIAWRLSAFKLMDNGVVSLSPRTKVGEAGAGPKVMKAKRQPWVKLRHKPSGRVYFIGNAHLAASIHLAIRRKLHIRQTNRIRDWMGSRTNNVIAMGDYNIDAKVDARQKQPAMPFVKFRKIGVRSNYYALGYPEKGTHGNRYIDYVWYRVAHKRFKPTTQRVVDLSSDHRALLVRFKSYLTARKRAQLRLKSLTGR